MIVNFVNAISYEPYTSTCYFTMSGRENTATTATNAQPGRSHESTVPEKKWRLPIFSRWSHRYIPRTWNRPPQRCPHRSTRILAAPIVIQRIRIIHARLRPTDLWSILKHGRPFPKNEFFSIKVQRRCRNIIRSISKLKPSKWFARSSHDVRMAGNCAYAERQPGSCK